MITGALPLAEEVLEDFDVEEFETQPFLEEAPVSSHDEMLTLGIETSCDETSVAILRGARDVLSNVISSSADLHGKFGGVVPEVASRAHVEAINPAIEQALRDARVALSDISVVGVTIGPGLIGSLTVGVAAAKSLSSVLDIPLVGVNHLEAHLYACLLEHKEADFPALGLIVSGGHTLLVNAVGHGLYEIIGQTLDDAVGEAFDKIGRFLGLGFPGGPAIDAAARLGDPKSVALPRALRNEGYDFSFSGLKTAVVNYVRKQRAAGNEPKVEDICASFQEAAVEISVIKTMRAVREREATTLFLAGGVAANSRLRASMSEACREGHVDLYYPSPVYCTDNAAMVACCAFHRYRRGVRTGLDEPPDPNLPLA